MTETEAKWMERVRGWRASGKTAEDFAAEQDFEPSTLRYWASRLKIEIRDAKVAPKPAPPTVAMARVIRRRRRRPQGAPHGSDAQLAVVVGGARITVGRGFDAALLREVVAALGGGK
jgi:hypothetical protein